MSSGKMRSNTEHASNYVQEVFANRLEQEGFKNVDGHNICWYRVKNPDVINTITFFSQQNRLPLMLRIGCGIHPLFAEPHFSRNVYIASPEFDKERFTITPIVEVRPEEPMCYKPFSQEAWVYVPGRDGRGIYTFDQILLPQMDNIHTIEDCYRFHKETYLSFVFRDAKDRFNSMSQTFIDEVIYVDDVEMYPICLEKMARSIAVLENARVRNTASPKDITLLDCLLVQQRTILENDRKAYMLLLEQRKKKNVDRLQKKFGISF